MKQRGAQTGNTNALKHGFYSRQFRQIDLADLDSIQTGLEQEIALLRVQMRRALETINSHPPDPDYVLKSLSVLGSTATRIAGITRAQNILTGGDKSSMALISQAIAEINKELKLT
jgi:two-component sensor histidine kinase